MDSDYVAWNGERYVWPPPDDWYLASDGRWWAPDTGPDMDFDAEPAVSGIGGEAGQVEIDYVEPVADPGPSQRFYAPETSEGSGFTDNQPPVTEAVAAVGSNPDTGSTMRPAYDETSVMAAGAGDTRNQTMVMAEAPRTHTGQHEAVSADPDASFDDRPPILEPANAPPAQAQRSRTMTIVAAGLLAAAAIGIAALLALLGGDNETQTQQPSASSSDVDAGSDGLVVSTDDSGTETTADGAMDDAMSDGDVMGEDGAMGDEDQDATSTTAAGSEEGGEDAAQIGQFRALLENNQITAAALTGDDLTVFGDTACSYATSAADLPEYEQIRNDALNGAQNDELTIDELQFVVDAAVTVFCAEDAARLGVTATAPPADGG